LGPVEAVDLVDEQQGPLPHPAAFLGPVEHLTQVGDTGKHRRQGLEMQGDMIGQKPRHGRLPRAGRPPEHDGGQLAGLDRAADETVGTGQMGLADDLGDGFWPQAIGQRAR